MNLPVQAPPVTRDPRLILETSYLGGSGLTVSQSICDNLTGLAQQMCIATEYGVSI
jgi:hypothetical protein